MAKIEWLRYLALGAGAVITPVVVTSILPAISTYPFLSYAVQGISVADVLLAGTGVLAVDMIGFKK